MAARSISELMAAAARELHAGVDDHDTMQAAVALAARDVDGADDASLSIVGRDRTLTTPVSTSDEARRSDELQYELGQGPCVEAVWDERLVLSSDLRRETRWAEWARRMVEETPFRSVMCIQLFTTSEQVGGLNLYARLPDAFDITDRDYAEALAAHVAVAVRAAQESESLQVALDSRTTIGQALGILMERFDIDDQAAFAVLSRLASTTERKVRDIAAELVSTRVLPGS